MSRQLHAHMQFNEKIDTLDTNDLSAVYKLRTQLLEAYRAFYLDIYDYRALDAKIDNRIKDNK